ncbi:MULTISPECIES: zinc ribbon domain-containing protein [Haloplanus]|uniref:zinc ribbon domain-containing protein n=1 Tax=Haloplanus TaxID=376170 RepID=UPI0018EEC777|nr:MULTISPECIES: zinc ribbon domain-containing protein [Haloplanus]
MVVAQTLSVVLYGAAVAGDHPDIDAPDNLSKFSGFLRIGAIILLLVGLALAVGNLSGSALGASAFAILVVMLLGLYDYTIMAKKKRQAAKETVAKAGKEYLETKKEVEKGPDQVTNVQGDMVDRKNQQTHVDQSTTNVDTIDQSTTRVDQSKTVKDQRTQVEDSVVNRSDITASAEPEAGADGGRAGGERAAADRPPQGQGGRSQPQGDRAQRERRQGTADRRAGEPARTDRQSHSQGGGSAAGDGGGGSPDATRFCTHCGEEVDPEWNTCISCGADL